MEKLTLKDIADRAGVSMMTVSNVINGKSSRVSAQTAEKINDIIKESGYVPNLTARSLTKKSSAIVLLLQFSFMSLFSLIFSYINDSSSAFISTGTGYSGLPSAAACRAIAGISSSCISWIYSGIPI